MDDRKLPFLEHLRELRIRLRNALGALLLCSLVTFYFSQPLFSLLARPLEVTWAHSFPGSRLDMGYASLTEPFWVYFELSIYAAVFLASPFIFHQMW